MNRLLLCGLCFFNSNIFTMQEYFQKGWKYYYQGQSSGVVVPFFVYEDSDNSFSASLFDGNSKMEDNLDGLEKVSFYNLLEYINQSKKKIELGTEKKLQATQLLISFLDKEMKQKELKMKVHQEIRSYFKQKNK